MIKKEINKQNLIIIICFILALASMTIGFASYNKVLNIAGTAIVKPDGTFYIDSVTLTSGQHATANPVITNGSNIDFNLSLAYVQTFFFSSKGGTGCELNIIGQEGSFPSSHTTGRTVHVYGGSCNQCGSYLLISNQELSTLWFRQFCKYSANPIVHVSLYL